MWIVAVYSGPDRKLSYYGPFVSKYQAEFWVDQQQMNRRNRAWSIVKMVTPPLIRKQARLMLDTVKED